MVSPTPDVDTQTKAKSKVAHQYGKTSKRKSEEVLQSEYFRKQRKNFMKNGDRLRRRFGVDVYIELRRKGRPYIYTSNKNSSLLRINDLVSNTRKLFIARLTSL
jgi:hypothetical protein